MTRKEVRLIDANKLYEEMASYKYLAVEDVLEIIDNQSTVNTIKIENNKHLNGYMFDSLVYRYQLARQELAKYVAYYNHNRSLEQENMNANRDIMKFVQILDELVGEGNRD
jgi:hypothetical protein